MFLSRSAQHYLDNGTFYVYKSSFWQGEIFVPEVEQICCTIYRPFPQQNIEVSLSLKKACLIVVADKFFIPKVSAKADVPYTVSTFILTRTSVRIFVQGADVGGNRLEVFWNQLLAACGKMAIMA